MKPGNASALPPPRERIALLAAYLLSSGRRLLEEPPDYAIYRLVEGARRALELLLTCVERYLHLVSVRFWIVGFFYVIRTVCFFAVL
jgi:hypothetical protein